MHFSRSFSIHMVGNIPDEFLSDQADMAKSQPISIASQWGRSIVSSDVSVEVPVEVFGEQSDPIFFIRSCKRFENRFVAIITDVSANGSDLAGLELFEKRQKDGAEHTKCVRQVIGRMG